MMDTQRLIAFVVFSFSALMLWDAWQKHNAPKPVPTPAASSVPAGVPQPSTSLGPPPATSSSTVPGIPGPSPAVPTAAPAPSGESVNVKTDLFDIDLNTVGGDIRRLTLLKVFS